MFSCLQAALISTALVGGSDDQAGGLSRGPVTEALRAPAVLHAGGSSGGGRFEPGRTACLTDAQRAAIHERLEHQQEYLTATGQLPMVGSSVHSPFAPGLTVFFKWPIKAVGSAALDYGVHGISNFVDMDRSPGSLLDYQCGTRTYDNHAGIDIFSWPFPWKWMDEDAVQIVAAAPGVIIWKSDGNFDQSCAWTGGPWNAVYVQHADGSIAWYGHMKNGSVTTKPIGSKVGYGDFLGVMGSSGNSTGPHLHLEVFDKYGNLTEPFTGPCHTLSKLPTWASEPPYFDSAINRVQVGDAPIGFMPCPGITTPNDVSSLMRGTTGYFTTFYRDQLAGQPSNYRILRPDGSTAASWTHSSSAAHYAASWWWWSWGIPSDAPTGLWTFQVSFQGKEYASAFMVEAAGGSPVEVLADPSFEVTQPVTGFPLVPGDWGGDLAASVLAENGVQPFGGASMLKHLATNGPNAGSTGGASVWQIVDLQAHAASIQQGGALVFGRTRVNRAASTLDNQFEIRLEAYDVLPVWGQMSPLTTRSTTLLVDSNPGTWETLSLSMALPPATRYVTLMTAAAENVVNNPTFPEFGGHYTDGTSLLLSTN